MQLYLLRHADAVPFGEQGIVSDFDRPLTEKGRKQSAAVGVAMDRLGIELDLILTSPLVRAVETARLAAEKMGMENRIKECEAVANGELEKLCEEINALHPANSICLVGHEPTFGDWIGQLVWGTSSVSVPMKKAGLALIEVDHLPTSRQGDLRWILTGKQVVLLSKY